MRGNNMFGGMMILPPWAMAQEPMQAAPRVPDIVVPARVVKAMEFLNTVTAKTAARAAANEMSIETIPGQKLSPEEENAQSAALNCLTHYFDGRLKMDEWEQLRHDAIKKQAETGVKKGTLCNCLMCGGLRRPKKDCPLCEGSGTVLVLAARPEEIQPEAFPPAAYGEPVDDQLPEE